MFYNNLSLIYLHMKNYLLKAVSLLLLVFAFLWPVFSQTCPVGYNVVYLLNEDFGTFTSESGRASSPNIQNVSYDGSGDVGNGNYAIVAECKKSGTSWAVSGYDHTSQVVSYPSGTYGGMFFFNAGETKDVYFYKKEVTVCAGTQLYFSVWYANAHPSSSVLPNVTFEIYGKDPITSIYTTNPIATATSGNISKSTTGSTQWNQLSLSFSSAVYETVELRIRNNVDSNTGNDLLLDGIQIIACMPFVDFVDGLGVPDVSETITDPTASNVSITADATQLAAFNTPYYITQYSLDGSTWDVLEYNATTSEWEVPASSAIVAMPLNKLSPTIKVNIEDFCETTYLRLIISDDPNIVQKVVQNNPSAGCYSISSIFTLTKNNCEAPTSVTYKVYKGSVALNLSPTPEVCKGANIRIEATAVGGSYGVISGWKWEYTNACIPCGDTWHEITGQTTSSITIPVNGNFIYRAIPTVKICAGATYTCTATSVPDVTINSIGAIVNNLTLLDGSASTDIYCGDGTAVTLKALLAGPYDEAKSIYQYSADNGVMWTQISSSDWVKVSNGIWNYTESPAITTQYRMFASSRADATGQVCTSNKLSSKVAVNVLTPVISNSLLFDDGSASKTINCGDNTTITLKGSYGDHIDVVSNKLEKQEEGESIWQLVDVPASTPFSFTETPQKSATYRFSSYSTCTGVSPVVSMVDVIVNIPPVVNTLSADKTIICGDGQEQISLTATVQGPVAGNDWEYSEDDGIVWHSLLPAPNGLVATVSPVVTTMYRLISTSACDATALTASAKVRANQPFNAILEIQATADKSKIFLDWDDLTYTYTLPVKGADVPMLATTDMGGIGYKYNWSPNAMSSVNTYTAKNLAEPAIYSVAITDADGKCTSVSNNLNILVDEVVLTSVIDFRSESNNTFGRYDYNVKNPLVQQLLSENLGNYKLIIFNRYGQKMITTGMEGWDGKVNGKEADAGIYYYVLEYTAGGAAKQIKGSVEIIK